MNPEVSINPGASLNEIVGYAFGVWAMMAIGALVLCAIWGVYALHIRIARKGRVAVDIGCWIGLLILTATWAAWLWGLLDINRLILSKTLYTGDEPVEYAWNLRSKPRRREWEESHAEDILVPKFSMVAAQHDANIPEDTLRQIDDLGASLAFVRRHAAEELGKAETSDPIIVAALMSVYENDSNLDVRNAAGIALQAPVHQAQAMESSEQDVVSSAKSAIDAKSADALNAKEKMVKRRKEIYISLVASGFGLACTGTIILILSFFFPFFKVIVQYWMIVVGVALLLISTRFSD